MASRTARAKAIDLQLRQPKASDPELMQEVHTVRRTSWVSRPGRSRRFTDNAGRVLWWQSVRPIRATMRAKVVGYYVWTCPVQTDMIGGEASPRGDGSARIRRILRKRRYGILDPAWRRWSSLQFDGNSKSRSVIPIDRDLRCIVGVRGPVGPPK